MKLAKLKYYYLALNETAYGEFSRTRQLLAQKPATIDIVTGQVNSVQPFHFLYARPSLADTRYRQLNHWTAPVFVLRIPAHAIPRTSLTPTDDPEGMWLCRADLSLAHCGVERFDLPDLQPEPRAEVVASSRPLKVVIPIE